eukprot:gene11203-12205_t
MSLLDPVVFQPYPTALRVFQSYGSLFVDFLHIQEIITEITFEDNFELDVPTNHTVPEKKNIIAQKLNQRMNAKINAHLFANAWYINLDAGMTLPWAEKLIQPIPFERRSSRNRCEHLNPCFEVGINSDRFVLSFSLVSDYSASLYESNLGHYQFSISGSLQVTAKRLSKDRVNAIETVARKIGFEPFCLKVEERLLESGNEVLKAVVAQYNVEELLSKRALVSQGIRDSLVARAGKFGLILDDVSITHLTFGKEFSRAIENKQVAQQEAETQAYVVLKADQERKAAVIRAEGEAEAAELIAKAMNTAGTGLIEVRRIDTAKDVANILSHGKNVTYLPGGKGGSNMLLNVGRE